jgi:hypothetical protein
MKCKEARATAIELVRSGIGVSDPHFEACVECARFLNAQLALDAALAGLSREVPVPANLEARLLTELDAAAHVDPRPAQRRFPVWIPAAAVAVSLAIAVAVIHRPVASPAISAEPFIEIPYIAPLAPYERTRIVRMDVPVSALIAAGFDMHAPDTGAALRADVLFGQDGRAHAIRLVSNSIAIPTGE